MFEKGIDQAVAVDLLGLSSLPSVVADDVVGLKRKTRRSGRGGHGGGGGSVNNCLISLQDSLNGLDVLNVLNGFGL